MCPLVCGLGDRNKKRQAVPEERKSQASGAFGDLNSLFSSDFLVLFDSVWRRPSHLDRVTVPLSKSPVKLETTAVVESC